MNINLGIKDFDYEKMAETFVNENHSNLSEGVKAKIKEGYIKGAKECIEHFCNEMQNLTNQFKF
jgi:hypothetical protein